MSECQGKVLWLLGGKDNRVNDIEIKYQIRRLTDMKSATIINSLKKLNVCHRVTNNPWY